MLRALLTAHISEQDLSLLTLQMNNKAIGHLTSEKSVNVVLSGNREVHLCSAYYSIENTSTERLHLLDEMKHFESIFKEMQNLGLAALPDLLSRYQADASFLMAASADLILLWQDRQKGVYLLRDGALFRLQPILPPQGVFTRDFMPGCDFYTLTPRADDLLILLTPAFVDYFKAEELEEVFSSRQQLHACMKNLSELGKTYGYNFEQSWFALQVQRAEVNSIQQGASNEMTVGEEQRRITRARRFSKLVGRSRVSRVRFGQALVPAVNTFFHQREHHHEGAKVSPRQLPSQARPRLGSKTASPPPRIEILDAEARAQRAANLEALAGRRKKSRWDEISEQLREFSLEPFRVSVKTKLEKFFSLWPGQPVLSKFFATASLILAFLLLLFIFRSLARRGELPPPRSEETTAATQAETVQVGVSAVAPRETTLEISHLVQANNLQLRSAPDAASALLGTIQRGEALLQLAPEEKGWIYVRDQRGVEGWVYADYLGE